MLLKTRVHSTVCSKWIKTLWRLLARCGLENIRCKNPVNSGFSGIPMPVVYVHPTMPIIGTVSPMQVRNTLNNIWNDWPSECASVRSLRIFSILSDFSYRKDWLSHDQSRENITPKLLLAHPVITKTKVYSKIKSTKEVFLPVLLKFL